jgi:RNA polymerase sigma-70 factor (ECF subfamily)
VSAGRLVRFDSDNHLINVFALDIADGVIQAVSSIINPDKLSHLRYALSDLARADREDE